MTTGVERMEEVVAQRTLKWANTNFEKLEERYETIGERRANRYINSFTYDEDGNIVRTRSGKVIAKMVRSGIQKNALNRLVPHSNGNVTGEPLSAKDRLAVLAVAPKHIWENFA